MLRIVSFQDPADAPAGILVLEGTYSGLSEQSHAEISVEGFDNTGRLNYADTVSAQNGGDADSPWSVQFQITHQPTSIVAKLYYYDWKDNKEVGVEVLDSIQVL